MPTITAPPMPTARHIQALPRPDELPDVFERGRRCQHVEHGERCITRLHRYHEGTHCYVHERRDAQQRAA